MKDDPLGQLVSSGLSGTTTAYGWDAVTNRTSVTVGAGTPATTAYDAANRPTSGASPTAAYASDADGRLTARPGQTMTWDHLGRLTAVKDASGTSTIASYSYDPLDRLRIADDGAAGRTRFRYTGSTTAVAQWIDDTTGSVVRNVGNGWGGERLLDWTGAGLDPRTYGTNAHHDVTWLADASGTVLDSLRYDPWGTPRTAVPGGYTPFRFQGSWHDQATDLAWVVTRWYAPGLGRFISEDSLLGEPREPDSRHLYAYAAGEPVGNWDPDGRLDYPTWLPVSSTTARMDEKTWRFIVDGRGAICVGTSAIGWVTKVHPGAGFACTVLAVTLTAFDAGDVFNAKHAVRRRVWRTADWRWVSIEYWYKLNTASTDGEWAMRVRAPKPSFEVIYHYPRGSEYAKVCATSNGTYNGQIGWCESGQYEDAYTSYWKRQTSYRGWGDRTWVEKSPNWPS